jgi:hypothetical protein
MIQDTRTSKLQSDIKAPEHKMPTQADSKHKKGKKSVKKGKKFNAGAYADAKKSYFGMDGSDKGGK